MGRIRALAALLLVLPTLAIAEPMPDGCMLLGTGVTTADREPGSCGFAATEIDVVTCA